MSHSRDKRFIPRLQMASSAPPWFLHHSLYTLGLRNIQGHTELESHVQAWGIPYSLSLLLPQLVSKIWGSMKAVHGPWGEFPSASLLSSDATQKER